MSDNRSVFRVIEDIAHEIITEREEQVEQWGQQDHPSTYSETTRRQAQRHADAWKEINAARVEDDTLTWDGILLEEVYEALAEADPRAMRDELVQVAAVAAAWIEAIDRALLAAEDDDDPEPEPEAAAA